MKRTTREERRLCMSCVCVVNVKLDHSSKLYMRASTCPSPRNMPCRLFAVEDLTDDEAPGSTAPIYNHHPVAFFRCFLFSGFSAPFFLRQRCFLAPHFRKRIGKFNHPIDGLFILVAEHKRM